MEDKNKASYVPPEIEEQRVEDLSVEAVSKHRKWILILVAAVVVLGLGLAVMYFTEPGVLMGQKTPSIFNTETRVPVAILTDDEGHEAVTSLGCVVSSDQFGVAPLSYFERIKSEKVFEIQEAGALLEAFGCLMPSLMASGLRTIPVSAIVGSDVIAIMPAEIHGVFSIDTFDVFVPKE